MGLLSALFGAQAKSRVLFKKANMAWRVQQLARIEGDDKATVAACLEVIRHCQAAITIDPMRGDSYVLLCNVLLSCSSRRGLDPSAGPMLRVLALNVFDTQASLSNNEGFYTKNVHAVSEVGEMLISAIQGDGVDLSANREAIDITSPEWLATALVLSTTLEGDIEAEVGRQPEKEFCGWVAAFLSQASGTDDGIPLELALKFIGLATSVGFHVASRDPQWGRRILINEKPPEFLWNVTNDFLCLSWRTRMASKMVGDDHYFDGIVFRMKNSVELNSEGNTQSFIFMHNVARIVNLGGEQKNYVPDDLFFAAIFESVWDSIAYWLALDPDQPVEEHIDLVDSELKPDDGCMSVVEDMMSNFAHSEAAS